MQETDVEFIQILNIIRRGQRLLLQAKKDGADVHLAEEYINEAKYALKQEKKELAIDYAKKGIYEVINAKRALSKDMLTKDGVLENLTKEELRIKCTELGIDTIGIKSELIERIKKHLSGEDAAPKTETAAPGAPKAFDPKVAMKEFAPGRSYLVKEKRPDRVFQIFKAFRDQNYPGMSISRTNPKILASSYGLNDNESIWLTGKEVQGDFRSVLPVLEFIMSLLEEQMEKEESGLILIDGLEFLLTNNQFNSVLRFLRQLVDNVSQTETILMVSLAPEAMDPTQVTLLEKDLIPVDYLE